MVEHINDYKLLNGRYGKYIRVETEDKEFINICIDPDIKDKMNNKNLSSVVFENIYKIFKLKHEMKQLRTDNVKLLE